MNDLPGQSQLYWRDHATIVEKGLIHAGKFERYFRLFCRWILPLAHSGKTVLRLLEDQGKEERKVFYNKEWDTWRWRAIFHFFFSRRMMGWLGRDPAFFRFVEDSVADRILTRVKHALTELPTHSNPYLTYILTGNFGSALPPYLERVSYERIKKNLDNLTLVQAPVEEAVAGGGFSGFNLSDIFEYLNPRQCEYIYRALLNAALPGARFAYWNMLVPRSCPEALAHRVTRLEESAQTLFLQDRAFFYSRFVLEEVK
jgi:S-adenosylmethionine-diacylglycerol 3-amino-3-carboxypropyl transferase